MERLSEREILRYLGYGNQPADEQILELVRECADLLVQSCRPRYLSQEIDVSTDGSRVEIQGSRVFESADLARSLAGCRKALLFVATLGVEADRLIARQASKSISRGAIMQAAATAFIEDYCDRRENELRREYEARGTTLGQRFSPGYGDFSLSAQKDIFEILQCEKKIGLTLTDELIMAPSKSVTAVLALGGSCGVQAGCGFCQKEDCLYRRKQR